MLGVLSFIFVYSEVLAIVLVHHAWPVCRTDPRSVRAALASRYVTRVVVSTDDDAIATAAKDHGGDVVRRPQAIAGDTASSESALLHALDVLEASGPLPAKLVFLQCTSPFTTSDQIDRHQ